MTAPRSTFSLKVAVMVGTLSVPCQSVFVAASNSRRAGWSLTSLLAVIDTGRSMTRVGATTLRMLSMIPGMPPPIACWTNPWNEGMPT